MIQEARVFDISKLTNPGLRVLTTRQWIRGISRSAIDVWLPDAGPSPELLQLHREGLISWAEFEHRYREEQQVAQTCRVVRYNGQEKVCDKVVNTSPVQRLRAFERYHGTVTVLCWERGCECHRFILQEIVSEL